MTAPVDEPAPQAPRTPLETVVAHLAAVATGDPAAMAADYAPGAVLSRDVDHVGRDAIAAYFETVPSRLGGGVVRFGGPEPIERDRVTVRWRIEGGPGDGSTGTDTFVVVDGRIVHQVVALDGRDF